MVDCKNADLPPFLASFLWKCWPYSTQHLIKNWCPKGYRFISKFHIYSKKKKKNVVSGVQKKESKKEKIFDIPGVASPKASQLSPSAFFKKPVVPEALVAFAQVPSTLHNHINMQLHDFRVKKLHKPLKKFFNCYISLETCHVPWEEAGQPPGQVTHREQLLRAKGRPCGGREVVSRLKEMKYCMQRAY